MEIDEAIGAFPSVRGYLDTATVGVPTIAAAGSMTADIERWASGQVDARHYDGLIDRARGLYASLVGADASTVGIVSQVSVATGVAVSALRPGDEVLVVEEDFTSVLFGFLQARASGVEVRIVPLAELLDHVTDATTMIAVSAVQSADGRVLDLDALADAASTHGCLTYVDTTQAASWLPIGADRFSMTACGGYKWLCLPRGTGFTTVQPEVAERFTPVAAGWYAGQDVWSSIYGPPLRLATDGRRFDVSPAWSCWAGAVPTLEVLVDLGTPAIGAHDIGLANAFRDLAGMAPSDSAVVTVDEDGALEALSAAGIRCAGRAGRARLAFHLYATPDDVETAAEALA